MILLGAEPTGVGITMQIEATRPTAVQVVATISATQAALLAGLAPHVRRIQVVHAEGRETLDMIAAYAPYVDAFLLDSGRPSAAD